MMDWEPIKQGFKDAGAQTLAFREAHPILVNNIGCFVAGLIVGFILG
jgi:hypothetical protein